MNDPQACLSTLKDQIKAMSAFDGPLTESDGNALLDKMEDVLELSGYRIEFHEQLEFSFSKSGASPAAERLGSYYWFASEVEALCYAYSDILGETDSTNCTFVEKVAEENRLKYGEPTVILD